jgi:hypothetical protein
MATATINHIHPLSPVPLTDANRKLKIDMRGSAANVVLFLERKNTIIKTKRTQYLTNLAFRIFSIAIGCLNLAGTM